MIDMRYLYWDGTPVKETVICSELTFINLIGLLGNITFS